MCAAGALLSYLVKNDGDELGEDTLAFNLNSVLSMDL